METGEHTLSSGEIEAIARRIDRPVVLVGMMGVGKSSIGRKLAAMLHLPFVDADEEIVAAAQMTIAEMFETYGEGYFRDGERRVIARLIDGEPKVIASGGGAFVNPETRALIRERALAVWLDCDIETLLDRVGRKSNRPLLQGGDPRKILARLQRERREAYAEAPIHVTSNSGPHGRAAVQIVQEIGAWL